MQSAGPNMLRSYQPSHASVTCPQAQVPCHKRRPAISCLVRQAMLQHVLFFACVSRCARHTHVLNMPNACPRQSHLLDVDGCIVPGKELVMACVYGAEGASWIRPACWAAVCWSQQPGPSTGSTPASPALAWLQACSPRVLPVSSCLSLHMLMLPPASSLLHHPAGVCCLSFDGACQLIC